MAERRVFANLSGGKECLLFVPSILSSESSLFQPFYSTQSFIFCFKSPFYVDDTNSSSNVAREVETEGEAGGGRGAPAASR